MSTDYYMACGKCRESIHVAQDGMGGFTFYSGEPECMKALQHFLSVHTACGGKIEWIKEHVALDGDYKPVEWRPSHYGDERSQERNAANGDEGEKK